MNEHEKIMKSQRVKIKEAQFVIDNLPLLPEEGLTLFMAGGYCAGATAKYEVETRADALELLSRFETVPLMRARGACLSFVPADLEDTRDFERHELNKEIHPAVWEFSPPADHPRAQLSFYAKYPTLRVNVHIEIRKDPAFYEANHRYTVGARGQMTVIVERRYRLQGEPKGHLDTFASGYDGAKNYAVYFDTSTSLEAQLCP